ncbi:MAG: hypothetical protein SFZ23_04125 [Planctomycetota bacterium]|nr:hypothetical protein [Planctomycetota bacterium]
MGLDFAIDELYASGWDVAEQDASRGCERHADGRAFPTCARVCEEFRSAGYVLGVRHIQLFDCYRAEWRDEQGNASGAVVGSSEIEAAVYALAQLRKNLTAALQA